VIEPTDEIVQALRCELPSDVQMGREPEDVRPWAAAVLTTGRDQVAVGRADLRTVLDQRDMHCHMVPGRWDGTGRHCGECAARGRLWTALGGPS